MRTTILLTIFLTTILVSCNSKHSSKEKSCCSKEKTEAKPTEISGESVYNLSSTWVTQKNESIQLSKFKDKIIVAAMIFTHCESACPRIVADMQRIESSMSPKELEQIDFLLISMDPERDTPARLTEFSKEHKLDAKWTLICSSQSSTMEIANVLGVRAKKLEDGGFDHSNIINVFDQGGVVTHQQNGFAVELDETIKAVKKLLK